MSNPNLIVTVTGGQHSGKSALAASIHKSLRKSAMYGSALVDGNTSTDYDAGPVKVLIQTQEQDQMTPHVMPLASVVALSVTKGDLKQAFLRWILDQRKAGNFMTPEECNVLPAGQLAENNAEYLYRLLLGGNIT